MPVPRHVGLLVQLIQRLAVPQPTVDLKLFRVAIQSDGVGGIGLQLDRIRPGFLGFLNDFQRGLQAAIMVGGEFGDDVGCRVAGDTTPGNSDVGNGGHKLSLCSRLPVSREQTKAHDSVVLLAVKVLIAQDPLLLKTQAEMKLNGAFVKGQCLTADLMQAELAKGMSQETVPQLASNAFGRLGCRIESPVSNAARCNLMQINEALRDTVAFEDQQM